MTEGKQHRRSALRLRGLRQRWIFNTVMPVALVLFLLCDTVIGLQVMGSLYLPMGEGSILSRILYPGFDLAWFFYLPSQVLLALQNKTSR